MSGPQHRALACELILTRISPTYDNTYFGAIFGQACKAFNVDLAKIDRKIRADRKDKLPAKKKKAAKRG